MMEEQIIGWQLNQHSYAGPDESEGCVPIDSTDLDSSYPPSDPEILNGCHVPNAQRPNRAKSLSLSVL